MTYSGLPTAKEMNMDQERLFKEYVEPFLRARIKEKRGGRVTMEELYREASSAFGMDVNYIRERFEQEEEEEKSAAGRGFLNAIPWVLGGIGAVGLGYAGMSYLDHYRKKKQSTEPSVGAKAKQGLEGRKVPPRAVELFGKDSQFGLVPKTALRNGKVIPVTDLDGRPIMEPIVSDDGTILNGDAYDAAVLALASNYPLRQEDTLFPQDYLDMIHAQGKATPPVDGGSFTRQPKALVNAIRSDSTMADIREEKGGFVEGAKGMLKDPTMSMYAGYFGVNIIPGAKRLFAKGADKVPVLKRAAGQLVEKAWGPVSKATPYKVLDAAVPVIELAQGLFGVDRQTRLIEDMNKALDPNDPKPYIQSPSVIAQTSGENLLYDKLRYGGDKDILSATSNPFMQSAGTLANIVLGTATGPFKEVTGPGLNAVGNIRRAVAALGKGDVEGAAKEAPGAIVNTLLTGLMTPLQGFKMNPVNMGLHLSNEFAKAANKELAAAKMETRRIHHDAALRDQRGWEAMDIAAKRRQATNPSAIRTVGDLRKAYDNGQLPSENIHERNRIALGLFRNRPDTPVSEAYSQINRLPGNVRKEYSRNYSGDELGFPVKK